MKNTVARTRVLYNTGTENILQTDGGERKRIQNQIFDEY